MTTLSFTISTGALAWGAKSFAAVSGPHGQGALPVGNYMVQTRHVVEGAGLSSSYRVNGTAFFIPIEPDFQTTRDGLGIHPDGHVSGTLGCIGLKGSAAADFWTMWTSTPMSSRPTKLSVVD